jgi:hypothetical protein
MDWPTSRAGEIYTDLPPRHTDKTAKQEIDMIIKQNWQYELHATLTPYNGQHSLELTQLWPQAQHPHHRKILQVLLSDAELAVFRDFLEVDRGAA